MFLDLTWGGGGGGVSTGVLPEDLQLALLHWWLLWGALHERCVHYHRRHGNYQQWYTSLYIIIYVYVRIYMCIYIHMHTLYTCTLYVHTYIIHVYILAIIQKIYLWLFFYSEVLLYFDILTILIVEVHTYNTCMYIKLENSRKFSKIRSSEIA